MSNVWSEGFSKNNNFDKFECNFGTIKKCLGTPIEIIDIVCGLLSRVSKKLFPQNGGFIRAKFCCQIGPLSRDIARIIYLIILWVRPSIYRESSLVLPG